ncbi:hypothetical protein SUGI_0483470 [Cryptomeria japonica]|uniref:uncharacterized protein LOC131031072 isoform X4 n=1 Tax=Cryptomeria japonica TaxID=3369 RepID=UPI002408E665|nr:uncharacterized protein LOC131031072 isoform X4 [Cryptomeria japonica]GLJ25255.1 hypothetical protein SUGI_0483470 [Cryptomeria japonica]
MAAPVSAPALARWQPHSHSSSVHSFTFTQVSITHTSSIKGRRKYLKCAFSGGAEKSLQSTIEMDRLIDKLRTTDDRKLPEIVAENILAFNSVFWMRLAARTEICESQDDQEDFKDLASSLMSIVDRVVQKAEEKIESATDVLKAILKPITNEDEEIVWPPKDPQSIILMKKELVQREQEGQLDETFLSEVNAQLGQAKTDNDKPGLVAILQKVLQLYASRVLSQRSYAKKGAQIIKAEEFLETIIKGDEEDWNRLLISGLILGGEPITLEELNGVIEKRIERTLMRTLSGSYQQRVLCEYLKEIKSRAEYLVQEFQKRQPS